jgi:hypothetical protein
VGGSLVAKHQAGAPTLAFAASFAGAFTVPKVWVVGALASLASCRFRLFALSWRLSRLWTMSSLLEINVIQAFVTIAV